MINPRTALQLELGDKAIINNIDSNFRMLELGFTPGQEIKLLSVSAFDGPILLSIRGACVAMRKDDAQCILID